MSKQLFVAALLIGLLVSLGACSKSDTNQSSVANVTNSADIGKNTAASENSGAADKQSGGQVTISAGADKNMVKVRSTGFR